jgi:hypothetical protein
MGGGPPSGYPFCGGAPADCPIAAPDAQAIHSTPAKGSQRTVLPYRMLVCLGKVSAPSSRGSNGRSVALLCRN